MGTLEAVSVIDVPGEPGQVVQLTTVRFLPVAYCCLMVVIGLAALASIGRLSPSDGKLRASTLLYLSSDPDQRRLAVVAHEGFGARVVDLASSTAGQTVKELLGTNHAVAPTLAMPGSNGPAVASGSYAVNAAFEAASSKGSPAAKGRIAIAVLVGAVLMSFLYRAEIAPYAVLAPVLGLCGIAVVEGRCLGCSIGTPALAMVAPMAGIAYLAAGFFVFNWPVLRARWAFGSFLALSAAIQIGQIGLVTLEPKLCWGCAAFGFGTAVLTAATWQSISTGALVGVAFPGPARALLGAAMGLVATRHGLILAGAIDGQARQTVVMPTLVGSQLSNYVRGPIPGRSIVLVTLPGCSACAQVRQFLSARHSSWKEYNVCALVHTANCFDAQDMAFPMPMVLGTDATGGIAFQFNGWPGDTRQANEIFNSLKQSIGDPIR